jgi:hypothetical protein
MWFRRKGTYLDTKTKYPESFWYGKANYTAYHTNGKGFIPYEEAEMICENLAEIEVYMHDSGMAATHNMPCSVCKVKHAVFSNGMFEPCWSCQEEGWTTIKMTKFERKWYEFWK